MNRVVWCRSICLTAISITEANLHLFELEDDTVLRPNESVLIVPRDSTPLTQTVLKRHHLRCTSKLFYLGLEVTNTGTKIRHQNKHTLLKKLLRNDTVKTKLHVIAAKDLHRAETKTLDNL
jgi:hypothetical protein